MLTTGKQDPCGGSRLLSPGEELCLVASREVPPEPSGGNASHPAGGRVTGTGPPSVKAGKAELLFEVRQHRDVKASHPSAEAPHFISGPLRGVAGLGILQV